MANIKGVQIDPSGVYQYGTVADRHVQGNLLIYKYDTVGVFKVKKMVEGKTIDTQQCISAH